MSRPPTTRRGKSNRALIEWIYASGGFFFLIQDTAREVLGFFLTLRQYADLVFEQLFALGVQSIAIVSVTGIATGTVMTLQFGYGLQKYGGLTSVPMLVGLAVFRELGPVLTSLSLAGRVGSGITAEIASMNVTQQVDAVRTLGTSPYSVLVFPRLVAGFLAFPVLGLIADYLGVGSGMLVAHEEFGMPFAFFLSKTIQHVKVSDLVTGVIKMLIFGFMVAVTACWKGLNTSGGTRSVGFATTWVVVNTSIMILISDILLNKIFISMGFFQ